MKLVPVMILVLSLCSATAVEATYPGQNGVIVFTAEGKPSAEATHGIGLFTVPSNTTKTVQGQVQLTSGDDYSASYSADGQRIAWVRFPGGYQHATEVQIWVANADGSDPTLVLSTVASGTGASSVSLSPDGTEILFETWDGKLFRTGVDGGSFDLVAERAFYGKWSPDGSKISYSHYGTNVYDDTAIYIANPDGSDAVEIETAFRFAVGANWSPDGTKLAFSGPGKGGHWNDLWVINVDGSGLTQLTDTTKNEASPAWAPDGTAIVYSRHNGGRNFRTENWKLDLATGKAKRIKTKFVRASFADWQPLP